jgi:hypothetical protein
MGCGAITPQKKQFFKLIGAAGVDQPLVLSEERKY